MSDKRDKPLAASVDGKTDAQLRAVIAEVLSALTELYAVVCGECPSLLDEDSGGSARLDDQIRTAIARAQLTALADSSTATKAESHAEKGGWGNAE